MSVCMPPSPKAVRGHGCRPQGTELFQEETASGCSPGQWAVDTSVHVSAFVSSSPLFTSSPSLPLSPAPAKGKSSFILPLGLVYVATATLCFVAEIYREKIMSESLAVQSEGHLGGALESHALCFKAGLTATQCSLWERRSVSALGGWQG